tara:strand:- start:475 stop:777 length:303 start_codon:yes stop_codon:yes gene_type:complete
MEKERRELDAFVQMHAKKAELTKDPCVYLVECKQNGIPSDITLERFSRDVFMKTFDLNSTLVQWVVKQMDSYDVKKEIVIGLIFARNSILTHVVRVIPDD